MQDMMMWWPLFLGQAFVTSNVSRARKHGVKSSRRGVKPTSQVSMAASSVPVGSGVSARQTLSLVECDPVMPIFDKASHRKLEDFDEWAAFPRMVELLKLCYSQKKLYKLCN